MIAVSNESNENVWRIAFHGILCGVLCCALRWNQSICCMMWYAVVWNGITQYVV